METALLTTDAMRELGWCNREPCRYDIAEANLLCAVGLPGAEELDVGAQLRRIDEIAMEVKRAIFLKENYDRFLTDSGTFYHSLPYFCIVCMISILKQQYGVKYNPAWEHISPDNPHPENDAFAHDAKDQFIHAILDGRGGTCGSLPVFFVAVGRRIGFPLRLVKTMRHLFMRWDDPFGTWSFDGIRRGAVFNIEATGQAIHVLSDDHYRTVWPHPLTDEQIETRNLLKSLTPEEELAEFLGMRWRCCYYNGRLEEAFVAAKLGHRLAPTAIPKETVDRLAARVEASKEVEAERKRAHSFIAPPQISPFSRKPIDVAQSPPATMKSTAPHGPRWIPLNDGSRALLQVLRPAHSHAIGHGANHPNVGIPLQRRSVQLPNGGQAWADVPIYLAHQPMAAFWIELSMNEFALVHKTMQGAFVPDGQRIGQPALPEGSQHGFTSQSLAPRLSPFDETALRQAATNFNAPSISLPVAPRAIPVDPATFAPSHAHLPPISHQYLSFQA